MTIYLVSMGEPYSDESWKLAELVDHKFEKGDLVVDLESGRVARIVSFAAGDIGRAEARQGKTVQERAIAMNDPYYGLEYFVPFPDRVEDGQKNHVNEAFLIPLPDVTWFTIGGFSHLMEKGNDET